MPTLVRHLLRPGPAIHPPRLRGFPVQIHAAKLLAHKETPGHLFAWQVVSSCISGRAWSSTSYRRHVHRMPSECRARWPRRGATLRSALHAQVYPERKMRPRLVCETRAKEISELSYRAALLSMDSARVNKPGESADYAD